MGTHPIFESDFDCLTDGRYSIEKAENRGRKIGKHGKPKNKSNFGSMY